MSYIELKNDKYETLEALKPIIQNDKTVKSFMGLTVFCCGIVGFYLI